MNLLAFNSGVIILDHFYLQTATRKAASSHFSSSKLRLFLRPFSFFSMSRFSVLCVVIPISTGTTASVPKANEKDVYPIEVLTIVW